MEDLKQETASLGDPSDDGQLTIRIPNPKVYMARQSLWIGRRGKPRCDHCRLNNLKCDRVLPACNHCSWATGRECKYTPLPTPAHRGIPRCDRCRLQNLKCDRSLPVCNHCKDVKKTQCNYTPKKRRKIVADAACVVGKQQPVEKNGSPSHLADFPEAHNFYGQNVASSSRGAGDSLSPTSDTSELPQLRKSQTGRFIADLPVPGRPGMPSFPLLAPKRLHSENHHPPLPNSFYSSPRIIPPSHFTPWARPPFAPLPEFMNRSLGSINPIDTPDRTIFNESLSRFLEGVMAELRETSSLAPDAYAAVSRCLSRGDPSKISSKLRQWASFHHLCSGSDKFNLILVPRESIYHIDEETRETYRRGYCTRVDNGTNEEGSSVSDGHLTETMADTDRFHRLPVQNQIFDILAYSHLNHCDSFTMILSIKKLGFASITWPMAELYTRLCPQCSFRSQQAESHHTYIESEI